MTVTPGQGITSPVNSTFSNLPINPFTGTPWFIGGVFSTAVTFTVPISGTPSVVQQQQQVSISGFASPLTLNPSTTGQVIVGASLAQPPDVSLQVYLPQLRFQSSQGTLATLPGQSGGNSFQLQGGQTYTNPSLLLTIWVNDTNAAPIAAGLPVVVNLWAMLVGQSQSNVVS